MSYETVRISELAKELGLPSKEVVEKFAAIGVTGKTHSSTVTQEQIKRLKSFIADGGVKKTAKPKAFVVKKAKQPVEEPKAEVKTPAEEVKPEAPKPKIEKVERPKVEVVKPASRLEIVRRAPRKPLNESNNSEGRDSRPSRDRNNGERKFTKGDRPQNSDKKFPPRGDKPQRPDSSKTGNKDFGGKKPLERRIISPDMYDNKGSSSKRKPDSKKKEKRF